MSLSPRPDYTADHAFLGLLEERFLPRNACCGREARPASDESGATGVVAKFTIPPSTVSRSGRRRPREETGIDKRGGRMPPSEESYPMIIWSGLGFLVPVIAFLQLFLTEAAVEGMLRDDTYYQTHGWPKLVAFLIAAAIIWPLGNLLNRRPSRVL